MQQWSDENGKLKYEPQLFNNNEGAELRMNSIPKSLFSILQPPELWQRSSEKFWDDEHISLGMLNAHLNRDIDSASRNHTFIKDSVNWISSLISKGSDLLDLGCGPGLYTKPLAEAGHRVTGMDLSKRSIEYAISVDSKTEYIYSDYLRLNETNRYDLITLIYCDYAAFTPKERSIVIKNVYAALKPGGRFILDVFSETYFQKKENVRKWSFHETEGFWSNEPYLLLSATYLYDQGTVSVDKYIVIKKNCIKTYLIWDTAFTIEKLKAELLPLTIEGVYADVAGTPYFPESEIICVVATKPLD